jgi:hypothetical protein
LRDADPALLQRLDFDPENAGTAVGSAMNLEDEMFDFSSQRQGRCH